MQTQHRRNLQQTACNLQPLHPPTPGHAKNPRPRAALTTERQRPTDRADNARGAFWTSRRNLAARRRQHNRPKNRPAARRRQPNDTQKQPCFDLPTQPTARKTAADSHNRHNAARQPTDTTHNRPPTYTRLHRPEHPPATATQPARPRATTLFGIDFALSSGVRRSKRTCLVRLAAPHTVVKRNRLAAVFGSSGT